MAELESMKPKLRVVGCYSIRTKNLSCVFSFIEANCKIWSIFSLLVPVFDAYSNNTETKTSLVLSSSRLYSSVISISQNFTFPKTVWVHFKMLFTLWRNSFHRNHNGMGIMRCFKRNNIFQRNINIVKGIIIFANLVLFTPYSYFIFHRCPSLPNAINSAHLHFYWFQTDNQTQTIGMEKSFNDMKNWI